MHDCDTYFTAWPRFLTWTIYVLGGPLSYDNINGPDGTNYVVIFGPAGPLQYVPGPNISLQALVLIHVVDTNLLRVS